MSSCANTVVLYREDVGTAPALLRPPTSAYPVSAIIALFPDFFFGLLLRLWY